MRYREVDLFRAQRAYHVAPHRAAALGEHVLGYCLQQFATGVRDRLNGSLCELGSNQDWINRHLSAVDCFVTKLSEHFLERTVREFELKFLEGDSDNANP